MFSAQITNDLKAELHGITERYFPHCHPCYRRGLYDFLFHSCMIFERHRELFNPIAQPGPEDPLRDDADPDDVPCVNSVTDLPYSPAFPDPGPADPDPPPKPRRQTGRHREPPPPPLNHKVGM